MAGKAVYRKLASKFGEQRASNYLYGQGTNVKLDEEFEFNGKTYLMKAPPEQNYTVSTSGISGLGHFSLKYKDKLIDVKSANIRKSLTDFVSNKA
jgi:hypothetical protein